MIRFRLRPPFVAVAAPSRTGARSRHSPALRPAVEQLEAREVPATYSWLPTGPGAYNWDDPANWSGGPTGTFPDAAGDVANLTGALTGNQVINLNGSITVGALNLGTTGSAGAITIAANGAGGSLTFDVTSGAATLSVANNGGDAILAPIVLNDNLALSGGGSAAVSLGGDITGTGTITATGTINLFSDVTVGSGVTVAGTTTFTASPVLFTTSYYDNAVYGFDSGTGALLATLVAPNTTSLLSQPAGLTVGPDGNLYISGQDSNAILRYNLDTDALETFISSSVLQPIAMSHLSLNFAPAGLRFGPDGDLYVSLNGGFLGFSGAVIRFDVTTSGGALTYAGTNATVASGLVQPTGLAFGTAPGDTGNLYISSSLFGGVLKVTGATGGSPSTSTFVANNSGGLQFPSGLAFGPDGDLYVADLGAFDGNGQVLRYNSDGSFDSVVVAPGTGANPGDLLDQFPSDLLFDGDGRLLLANLGPNGPTTGSNDYAGSVYRYSSTRTFDTALVTAAQFPDSSGPVDSTATGIIPSQIALGAVPVLTVAGTLAPAGGAAGTTNVGAFAFTSSAHYAVDLTAGGSDQLAATGAVNLNGATLDVTIGFAAPVGATFTVLLAPALNGTFNGLADGATFIANGQLLEIDYTATAVILRRV